MENREDRELLWCLDLLGSRSVIVTFIDQKIICRGKIPAIIEEADRERRIGVSSDAIGGNAMNN